MSEGEVQDQVATASVPLAALLRDYEDAVQEFARTARGMDAERWSEPLAPGKWSPEELTVHVALAYEGLLGELTHGQGMSVRTKWWQRIYLRAVVLPRFLKGIVPSGAPAPRETRPDRIIESGEQGSREECIVHLERTAAGFLAAVLEARGTRPRTRLTHPYFGGLRLDEVLPFVAAHTRHHCGQLRESGAGGRSFAE